MSKLQQYLAEFDTYPVTFYYKFVLECGGIADCLKFFAHMLEYCIDHKVRLLYILNDIPIEKYIRVRHEKMRIHANKLPNNVRLVTQMSNRFHDMAACDDPNIGYVFEPYLFYNTFSFDKLSIPFSELFEFSPECEEKASQLFDFRSMSPYTAVHLRLGDKFLETDKRYVCCKNDVRQFDQKVLFDWLATDQQQQQPILFLCDNAAYKNSIKSKFSHIYVTEAKIGHTSFINTTDEQIVDTLAEFYLMANSSKIVAVSYSGFSLAAAKFHNTPISDLVPKSDR